MTWNKEQKQALAVCAGATGLIGVVIGYTTSTKTRWGIAEWIKDYPADFIVWLLIGAAIGGAGVFAYRSFSN
jgi:hypothetical protein